MDRTPYPFHTHPIGIARASWMDPAPKRDVRSTLTIARWIQRILWS